jgi:hypothetical protein
MQQPDHPSIAPHRADTSPLARRIASLRRSYSRGLARRPTHAQASAMMRAARLTAMAEAAAADGTTLNDLVRIERLASVARREMQELLAVAKSPAGTQSPIDRLREHCERIGEQR